MKYKNEVQFCYGRESIYFLVLCFSSFTSLIGTYLVQHADNFPFLAPLAMVEGLRAQEGNIMVFKCGF